MRLSDVLKDKFGDETHHLCPNCFETTQLRTNAIGAWKAYLIGKSPVKPSKYHHFCSKCYITHHSLSPHEGESRNPSRFPELVEG